MASDAPSSLEGKTVVVIGGTSGIGLHTVFQAAAFGASAIGASRQEESVVKAKAKAQGRTGAERMTFTTADALDEDALDALFAEVAPVHHVVVSVLDRGTRDAGLFAKTGVHALQSGLNKFWSSCHVGADQRKAWPGIASHAVVGGAMNAFARTMAAELAPMRVNVVNPGPTADFEYDPAERPERIARLGRFAETFALKRVGGASEVAAGVVAVMSNSFMTGSIIDIDGGAAL
jgi:NAD(P)-dependent dehydrogenase (short-subunit alcohol dehydrogenase family)